MPQEQATPTLSAMAHELALLAETIHRCMPARHVRSKRLGGSKDAQWLRSTGAHPDLVQRLLMDYVHSGELMLRAAALNIEGAARVMTPPMSPIATFTLIRQAEEAIARVLHVFDRDADAPTRFARYLVEWWANEGKYTKGSLEMKQLTETGLTPVEVGARIGIDPKHDKSAKRKMVGFGEESRPDFSTLIPRLNKFTYGLQDDHAYRQLSGYTHADLMTMSMLFGTHDLAGTEREERERVALELASYLLIEAALVTKEFLAYAGGSAKALNRFENLGREGVEATRLLRLERLRREISATLAPQFPWRILLKAEFAPHEVDTPKDLDVPFEQFRGHLKHLLAEAATHLRADRFQYASGIHADFMLIPDGPHPEVVTGFLIRAVGAEANVRELAGYPVTVEIAGATHTEKFSDAGVALFRDIRLEADFAIGCISGPPRSPKQPRCMQMESAASP